MTATPTKIKKTGNWGARIQGTATTGDVVTITTRSGKSWDAEVASIVWAGNGVTVCETRSITRRTDTNYTPESCGGRCPVYGHRCTPNNPCHDCY